MPPRGCARRAAARCEADARTASMLGSLAGQRQVDVLEGGPAYRESLELASFGKRLRGQLVEHACRLARSQHDLAAVPPVADLRLTRVSGQLRGSALADDHALAQHGDAIGQLLCLVEVVRGQQDRL